MPLRKFKRDDVETIRLTGEGEWVEVKSHLSLSDEREIKRRLMDGAAMLDARGALTWRPGSGEDLATFATLEQCIVRWNVLDPTTNKVAAITSENIRDLEQADVDVIVARCNELYPPPATEAQAKNSVGGGPTTTSEEDQPPPNSTS